MATQSQILTVACEGRWHPASRFPRDHIPCHCSLTYTLRPHSTCSVFSTHPVGSGLRTSSFYLSSVRQTFPPDTWIFHFLTSSGSHSNVTSSEKSLLICYMRKRLPFSQTLSRLLCSFSFFVTVNLILWLEALSVVFNAEFYDVKK